MCFSFPSTGYFDFAVRKMKFQQSILALVLLENEFFLKTDIIHVLAIKETIFGNH